ncbi:hypothetical protein V8E51_000967 [Hyaloscypha variabilis]
MHHHSLLILALAVLNSVVASESSASASASAPGLVIIPVASAVQTAELDIMSGMAMPTLASPPTSIPTSTPAAIITPTATAKSISTKVTVSAPANTTTTQTSRLSTVVVPSGSASAGVSGTNTTLPTVTGGVEGRSVKFVSVALGVMAGIFAFA